MTNENEIMTRLRTAAGIDFKTAAGDTLAVNQIYTNRDTGRLVVELIEPEEEEETI